MTIDECKTFEELRQWIRQRYPESFAHEKPDPGSREWRPEVEVIRAEMMRRFSDILSMDQIAECAYVLAERLATRLRRSEYAEGFEKGIHTLELLVKAFVPGFEANSVARTLEPALKQQTVTVPVLKTVDGVVTVGEKEVLLRHSWDGMRTCLCGWQADATDLCWRQWVEHIIPLLSKMEEKT